MDKLDILNRDKFVEQLVRLIENISDNKSSTCFAINGVWGSGKSFVLDMFEGELKPYSEKYFVVRYNCWKYDYYEEPLIAIVSSIIAEIDKKVNFLPDSQEKQEIIGMFKATGTALVSIVNDMIKSKTGADILDAYKKVKEGEKEGTAEFEKEHAYDTYLGLNKVIDKLSDLLADIAQEYTVVIIVDELDRCVPDYAIKVLERLHHLTEEKKNIITVVAIDKQQLESSVKQLFGFDDASKYLEKFFNFEVKLDKGELSEKTTEKYADYIALFDETLVRFEGSIDEYFKGLFKNIDIRAQEHIFKRAYIAHKLLYADENNKKDYLFMCTELLITLLFFEYGYKLSDFSMPVNAIPIERIFSPNEESVIPECSEHFKGILNAFLNPRYSSSGKAVTLFLPQFKQLEVAVFYIWYLLHKNNDYVMIDRGYSYAYDNIKSYKKDLIKFIETINLMK